MGHVLVLFQANTEPVEQLALAVAVGAVEAEGLIRLRRLAAPDAPELAHKSYGRLQPADLLWADVIVVGLETDAPNPAELGPLLDLLKETSLSAKRGWTFGPNGPVGSDAPSTAAQLQVVRALRAASVTLLPFAAAADSVELIPRMKHCGQLSARAPSDI